MWPVSCATVRLEYLLFQSELLRGGQSGRRVGRVDDRPDLRALLRGLGPVVDSAAIPYDQIPDISADLVRVHASVLEPLQLLRGVQVSVQRLPVVLVGLRVEELVEKGVAAGVHH